MKKYSLSIISLFILLAMLFSLAACDVGGSEKSSNSTETPAPEGSFKLSAEYAIVKSSVYNNDPDISSAALMIKAALTKSAGVKSRLFTNIDRAENTSENPYEILIGDTGRRPSTDALADLGVNDYIYRVESEKLIIICGGSSAATLRAVEQFCKDVLEYTSSDSAVLKDRYIEEGACYEYRDQYPYAGATLDGVDIKDYKIAISSFSEISVAEKIKSGLGAYTGYSMPIVKYEALTGEEKGVICLGAFSRDGEEGYNGRAEGGIVRVSKAEDGVTVGIDYSHLKCFDGIFAEFKRAITKNIANNSAVLELPEEEIRNLDFEALYGNIPTWELADEQSEDIADGVKYIERSYTDENDKPYKAYIMLVDPAKNSLYMGSSEDKYDLTPTKKQSVLGHMKAAAANGKTVFGGINGDFYNINTDYSPLGFAVKEGEVIKNNPDRAYCAFTYDGELKIVIERTETDTSNFRTCVGGSDVLVYEGLPYDTDMNSDFGYIAHPRTLVGVRADGTVIMAVIDGRQKELSNGAPLGQCAKLMIELGAEYAINLDGGGSSTMITCKDGEYETRNSPSDGNLRAVYNSLLVIANDEK